jgi:hypothetical protein
MCNPVDHLLNSLSPAYNCSSALRLYQPCIRRHFITFLFIHVAIATCQTSYLTAPLVVVGIGHHFISILSSTHFFRTWALHDLKTTPNLAGVLCGWIGMMIKVGAWGSLQGLTGLAPTREFAWRSHWTTHYCRTVNLIYSATLLHGINNSHYSGCSLKSLVLWHCH